MGQKIGVCRSRSIDILDTFIQLHMQLSYACKHLYRLHIHTYAHTHVIHMHIHIGMLSMFYSLYLFSLCAAAS